MLAALLARANKGDRMRRRDFLEILVAAIVAPSIAVAQIVANARRVGLLSPGAALAPDSGFGQLFFRALTQRGYMPDQNLMIDSLGVMGQIDRLPQAVDELVARHVEVIVALGYPAALAAKQRSGTVPVVVIGAGDPVATGLVASLAQPGGNVTGITEVAAELSAKRLDLLRQLLPTIKRVAILWNADDPAMTLRYRAAEAAGQTVGVAVSPLGLREPADFDHAFAAMMRDPPDAILLVSDVLTKLNRRLVYEFAAMHRLPAIYEEDVYVRDGGLMSYGPDMEEAFDLAAGLVDRLLKGARAAQLPLEIPTRFPLAINLRTAAKLGLTIPPSLLALADEVIE
jgi:putative tryptophan/tyrosine transport system substrate-binding protein